MLSVLIVDDEPEICSFIEFEIEEEGHKCYIATDGKQALEILTQHQIDIVFSDVMMPKMGGVELLKEVQKSHPQIQKFIFMSGFSEINEQEAIELGASGLLMKPVDIDKVKNFI